MPIAIIVHGGAGTISFKHSSAGSMALTGGLAQISQQIRLNLWSLHHLWWLYRRADILQAGCKKAALVGWRILQAGGSAVDAVEGAVSSLENNPNFNAGTGATLNVTGNIELDAGIMEGHTLQVGAIAAVQHIKNPISLARKVLESPHVLLVGKGAQTFALEQEIPLCEVKALITRRQYDHWKAMHSTHKLHQIDNSQPEAQTGILQEEKHGTVGAAALDTEGRLAAATSTGGPMNKYPGRVGDSPLVGCGFYANEQAAISCTGHGESFIRLLIAKRAADFVEHGETAHDAAKSTIAVLNAKSNGTGGLIIVDHTGNVGFAWNSDNMSYAYMVEGLSEPRTGI